MSWGSILALIIAPTIAVLTPLGALLGAIATVAAVYFLGRREGHLDGTTLLLGGIISASFLSAIILFLMTTLAQGDLPRDLGILRTAAQYNEAHVGIYASVLRGGKVRRDDVLRLL